MSQSPSHLTSVQMLRGVAALLVLFHHCGDVQRRILRDAGLEAYHDLPFGLWDNSYAGVDIFFVISGFIMVHVTAHLAPHASTAKRFLIARLIRIYPVWWIYLGIISVAYMFIHGMPVRPDYASDAGGPWLYGIRSFFLIPQLTAPSLIVGWTLIYEIYFYLLFAVFLLFSRRWLPLFLALWTAQIIIFNILSLPLTSVLNLIQGPLSLEFIMGACTALLWQRIKAKAPSGKQKFISLASLIIGVVSFCAGLILVRDFPDSLGDFGRVGLFGVPSALIIYGLVSLETIQSVRCPRWSVILGDISYSLYLGHLIVLTALRIIWQAAMVRGLPSGLHVGAPGVVDNVIFASICISVSIIAAWIAYYGLERPLIRWLRTRLLSRSPTVTHVSQNSDKAEP